MIKQYSIVVNGNKYMVDVEEIGATAPSAPTPRAAAPAFTPAPAPKPAPAAKPAPASSGSGSITAPMPGKVLSLKKAVGDSVKTGDVVLILEAMKMENEIVASADGTIKEICISVGSNVNSGDTLVVIG